MTTPQPSVAPSVSEEARRTSFEKAAILFSSLSNTVRLGILTRLIIREWSVNELAADLKMSQSALSQHLAKLRQAGVVRARRDRQTIFYHCNEATVMRLLLEVGLGE